MEKEEAEIEIAKIKKNLKFAKIAAVAANIAAAITFAVIYYLIKDILFLILAIFMVVVSLVFIKVINHFQNKILSFEQQASSNEA